MKKKCDVCGLRFRPERDKVYKAYQPQTVFETLTQAGTCFDMVDCLRCGYQVALAVRLPAVAAKDEESEAGGDE